MSTYNVFNIVCRCNEIVMKSTNDGVAKIRSKILLLRDNKAYAVCKSCNQEVQVPLTIDREAVLGPRLILSK